MRREDYRATVIVMLGLVAATLTGFVRQAALAYHLGTGRGADIFLIAFTIPEFVLIALPIILPPAFIPLFAECRRRIGETGAWRFGLRVAGVLLAVLLGSTVIAILGAPIYLRWMAPGFDLGELENTVRAARLMMPVIVIVGGTTLTGAALHVYRHFARPALATAIYNTTFVIVMLVAPISWVVGRAAWGVTLGAAAALALQVSFLWRQRPPDLFVMRERIESSVGKLAPVSVTQVARLAGPLAVGYAVHHVIWFVDRGMATTLGAGSVATLNYAYRLALVVGQLSGLAVSTVLFPRLSEQVAAGELSAVRASMVKALRFVWSVGLPASCGLIILRTPLVRVLFERGAFDQGSTTAVSQVLVWYAIAVLADALCQPLWRLIYAWRSVGTVVTVNSLQTVIRILCNVVLIRSFGLVGLALSAMVGLLVQLAVLSWLANRRLRSNLIGLWWPEIRRVVFATIVTAVVTSLLAKQLHAVSSLLTLLVSGTAGGLTYLAALFLSKYSRNFFNEKRTNGPRDIG